MKSRSSANTERSENLTIAAGVIPAPLSFSGRWHIRYAARRLPPLTRSPSSVIPVRGTPLPTERQLSGRIDDDNEAECAAACAAFLLRPCAKHPGWKLENLKDALLGRSHRSKAGKAKLKRAIELTREILNVPANYRIGIVPASDTGAVEMALWSMLGARPVDLLAWESFGEGWVTDVVKQLKLKDARILKAPYGELPDLGQVDFSHDVVFHLERHHVRRTGAERRLDQGGPRGPHDL